MLSEDNNGGGVISLSERKHLSNRKLKENV